MTSNLAPRQVNPQLAELLKAVNEKMAASYGVTYREVFEDIDRNYDRLRTALDSSEGIRTIADRFVADVASRAGLQPASPGFGADAAREHNLRQAALVNFSRETAGWVVGTDGVYTQTGGGVVQLRPDQDPATGRWRFAASVGTSSTLDPSVKPKSESFFLDCVTHAQDIDDAWKQLIEARPDLAARDPDADNSPDLPRPMTM